MKKILCITLLLVLLVGAVWASAQKEEVAAKKAKVVWWTWVDWTDTVNAFMAENPNIDAEFVRLGVWDVHDKFLVSLSAGSGGADVISLVQRRFPMYSSTGKLADMTPYVKELQKDFPTGIWKLGVYDGKVFGMAMDKSPGVLWHRKDLLAKAGVGKIVTIDDFKAAGAKVKAAGMYLFPSFYPSGGWGNNHMNMWLNALEGNIYTADGKLVDPNPKLKKVLDFYDEMLLQKEYSKGMTFYKSDFYAAYKQDQFATFAEKVAEGNGLVRNLPEQSGKWSVSPWPQWEPGKKVTPVWGGTINCVPDYSKNKEAAIALVKWVSGTVAGQVAINKENHFVPALGKALEDPQFKKGDPFFSDVVILDQVHDIPPTHYWDWAKTTSINGKHLDLFFSGQQSADDTYKNMLADLHRELKR